MLLVALEMGFRQLASAIPVVGTCSVAISAACYPPEDGTDAAQRPVQWGAVQDGDAEEVGHASFSSQVVENLVPGKMYALEK